MPQTSVIKMIKTIQEHAIQLSFHGLPFTTEVLQTRVETDLGIRPGDAIVQRALENAYDLDEGEWWPC